MQSIVTFLGFTIVTYILGFIPIIGWILIPLVGLLEFIVWIVLIVKAYRGEKYKLPWAGEFAEKQVG